MGLLKKMKGFMDGCFDYENPSAGCCKGIGAIPGIQKEYRRMCDKDVEEAEKGVE